jgi:Na+/H+ antiporter NhaD/arsenite permease-like protein
LWLWKVARLLALYFFFGFFFMDDAEAASVALKNLPRIETAIPFIGVLLSIAFCPLLIPNLWKRFENLILIAWSASSLWLCLLSIGRDTTILLTDTLIREYIPFITLVSTLFIISNGIDLKINVRASTMGNIIILGCGEILANFIGTTGTAILLLRPLLEVNKHRKNNVHTVIFFIFLVSNIGGCLLPFGDPPLFLGYLKGVDFFWTLKHMFPMFCAASVALLVLYGIIDIIMIRKERAEGLADASQPSPAIEAASQIEQGDYATHKPLLHINGWVNVVLMILVVVLFVCTGNLPKKVILKPFGVSVHSKNLIRDLGLLVLAGIAFLRFLKTKQEFTDKGRTLSQKELRAGDTSQWAPLSEVIRFFLAIFVTMAPVAAMLKGGHEFFAPISRALASSSHPAFLYFWFVSPFSAFLDNAPTYLIFFKMAGGNAQFLMNEGVKILIAISAGSVFMGSVTYIGNAPNFMVRTIAKQYGVNMPNFFGYTAMASLILLPLFFVLGLVFLY